MDWRVFSGFPPKFPAPQIQPSGPPPLEGLSPLIRKAPLGGAFFLSLTDFIPWVGFVDDVYAAFAADDAAIFVAAFQGF